jgi:hypothetical protein
MRCVAVGRIYLPVRLRRFSCNDFAIVGKENAGRRVTQLQSEGRAFRILLANNWRSRGAERWLAIDRSRRARAWRPLSYGSSQVQQILLSWPVVQAKP